jgi:hypothetical protein
MMTATHSISSPVEARVVAWSLGVSLAFVLAALGVAALA